MCNQLLLESTIEQNLSLNTCLCIYSAQRGLTAVVNCLCVDQLQRNGVKLFSEVHSKETRDNGHNCKGHSDQIQGEKNAQLEWLSHQPERLRKLHPWRYLKLDWQKPEHSDLPLKLRLFWAAVEADDSQRSLPT